MTVTVFESLRQKVFRLEYLPVVIFLLVPFTITITFYLSYINSDHVTYLLPYISDTGTYPPESCIFGQALNLSSILIGLLMFVKYCQVQEIFTRHHIEETFNVNQITLHIGYLACLGLSLVANFQETNVFTVHWIGAILTFGCGSAYVCLQTLLYLKLSPVIGQRKLTLLRIILSITSFVSFSTFTSCAFVAYNRFKGEYVTKWKPQDGGYKIHLVSCYAEWVCAASMLVFILMCFEEFSKLSLKNMDVIFKEDSILKNSKQSSQSASRSVTPESIKV